MSEPTQRAREDNHPQHGGPESYQDNVRFVLSGQPTGWAAMAQFVKNFDEEKIKDCKEDVDTLLVFVSVHKSLVIRP